MPHEYRLSLRAIRFRANMGVSRSERAIPQELLVDVDLHLPASAFPRNDQKRDVVDYDRVVSLVVEVGLAEPYRLLETYAERLVARLLDETPATHVRVATTKLRVPTAHSVDHAIVELALSRPS